MPSNIQDCTISSVALTDLSGAKQLNISASRLSPSGLATVALPRSFYDSISRPGPLPIPSSCTPTSHPLCVYLVSTMSLLRLPPEVLRHIFDQISPSFFHEDLGRLTICKQWFEFAHPASLKCITLSQEALRSLVTSELMKNPSPLQYNLETLKIEFTTSRFFTSTHKVQTHAERYGDMLATITDATVRDSPVLPEMVKLENDFVQLATLARKSPQLHTLCIRVWSYPSPFPANYPVDIVPRSAIQAFLSAENLTVLVLDVPGTPVNIAGLQGNNNHICPAIGALLHTLRSLHVRMPCICPEVLKPQDSNDSLRLSVVIVNLSLTTNLPEITSAAHSKRCSSPSGGLLQLKAEIQEQAEALATRMESPKTIRILTHSLPRIETQSLDVLTGKITILDDDMAWDEDGKTVEEDSEPESELLDDDFSSFLDD